MDTLVIERGVLQAALVAPSEVCGAVSRALTFNVPGARFAPSYKSGWWDGTISLAAWRVGGSRVMFPAGLTDRVAGLVRSSGRAVEVRSIAPCAPAAPFAERLRGVELRPYQLRVADEALKLGRAVIKAPTGSGKTEVGAELVRRLGLPTLWLTQRLDLMQQTAARLEDRLDVDIGRIGGGEHVTLPVTVGMVQTLSRGGGGPDWWRRWRVLVLDECHHSSADTWVKVAERCASAAWRFGLSATPGTGDPLRDARLEGVAGPLIRAASVDELVELGFLARPRIVMLRPPVASYPTYEQVREAVLPDWRSDPRRLASLGGRLYAEAYERGVVRNAARTMRIAGVAAGHAGNDEKVLVLCTRIAHGELLAAAVTTFGVAGLVEWIHGGTLADERAAALARFKTAAGGAVLVASEIFKEGVDVPEIDVLILAGGGQAEIATLQRVGRALRPRPGKKEALIYDVADGRDPAAKKDYLALHTQERLRVYREQGFAVEEAA